MAAQAFHSIVALAGTVLFVPGVEIGTLVSIFLAGIAVACLALATAIIARNAQKSQEETGEPVLEEGEPSPSKEGFRNGKAAVTPVSKVEDEHDANEDSTAPITPPVADDETAPIEASNRARYRIPSVEEIEQAEEAGEYRRAADMWRRRGNPLRELRALKKTEEIVRLAELHLALGNAVEAVDAWREALRLAPTDQHIRLKLIQSLLDAKKIREARDLADPVIRDNGPKRTAVSREFIASVARSFEARGEFRAAMEYGRFAVQGESPPGDMLPRSIYLQKLFQLARSRPHAAPDDVRKKLMPRVLDEDTGVPFGIGDSDDEQATAEPDRAVETWSDNELVQPHATIVGHLAMGGISPGMEISVRSRASIASRFELIRLVGERPTSVVFEGVDRLLDYPVAIRLTRVSGKEEDMLILAERLRGISQLNHPNLSKTTYADRYGPVVRSVTEYHQGGNLITLIGRLEKIGLPLALRLLLQIASGLNMSHRHGILHGDLRPENIMIGHDNLIKIVDFALRPWRIRPISVHDPHTTGVSPQITTPEAQSDLGQYADLIEFVLEKTMITNQILEGAQMDPVEEMREVVGGLRDGNFSSIVPVKRILMAILDQIIPTSR